MYTVHKCFHEIDDPRAWESVCLEQANDSVRKVYVDKLYRDADMEYLRQWLLKNGAEESDDYVFIEISW